MLFLKGKICFHEQNAMPSHFCYISIMHKETNMHNEVNMHKIVNFHSEVIMYDEMSLLYDMH